MAFGVEMNYTKRGDKDSQVLIPGSATNISGNSLTALGLARVSFRVDKKARPYLLGGFGMHKSKVAIKVTPNLGYTWANTGTREQRTFVEGSKSGLAGALRGGMEFDMGESGFIGFEGGWTIISEATYDATAAGQTAGLAGVKGGITNFDLFGRIGFKFGD